MPKERKLTDEIGRFVGVPQAMWQGGKLVISGAAFRVWCGLRFWIESHADDSMPTRNELLALTDIGNTRTLAAAIQELINEGWLETKKPFGEARRYSVIVPNRYRSEKATVAKSQPLRNETAYGSTFATVAEGKIATVAAAHNKELKKNSKREEERERERRALNSPSRELLSLKAALCEVSGHTQGNLRSHVWDELNRLATHLESIGETPDRVIQFHTEWKRLRPKFSRPRLSQIRDDWGPILVDAADVRVNSPPFCGECYRGWRATEDEEVYGRCECNGISKRNQQAQSGEPEFQFTAAESI